MKNNETIESKIKLVETYLRETQEDLNKLREHNEAEIYIYMIMGEIHAIVRILDVLKR